MEPDHSDKLSRAAAEFARAAARDAIESGIPHHRIKALLELFTAEAGVMIDRELTKLEDKIDASPQLYSVRERKEMMSAVIAAGMDRVETTIREQMTAWSVADLENRARDHDSA